MEVNSDRLSVINIDSFVFGRWNKVIWVWKSLRIFSFYLFILTFLLVNPLALVIQTEGWVCCNWYCQSSFICFKPGILPQSVWRIQVFKLNVKSAFRVFKTHGFFSLKFSEPPSAVDIPGISLQRKIRHPFRLLCQYTKLICFLVLRSWVSWVCMDYIQQSWRNSSFIATQQGSGDFVSIYVMF